MTGAHLPVHGSNDGGASAHARDVGELEVGVEDERVDNVDHEESQC